MQRSTCTALVPTGLNVGTPSEMNRPSEREAFRLAVAFLDGAYVAIERVFGRQMGGATMVALHRDGAPTYPQLRDYLMHDCNVDERIAIRIAFRMQRGQRGWH